MMFWQNDSSTAFAKRTMGGHLCLNHLNHGAIALVPLSTEKLKVHGLAQTITDSP
ncbi:MAG: hypothetical protein VKL39_00610 [Leptolyngbyaceae bacterium]|nr:hypothetical protein [Leptolyngbyaceae bacterium]